MKIFYTSTTNGIDQDLDHPCPFRQKVHQMGLFMLVLFLVRNVNIATDMDNTQISFISLW